MTLGESSRESVGRTSGRRHGGPRHAAVILYAACTVGCGGGPDGALKDYRQDYRIVAARFCADTALSTSELASLKRAGSARQYEATLAEAISAEASRIGADTAALRALDPPHEALALHRLTGQFMRLALQHDREWLSAFRAGATPRQLDDLCEAALRSELDLAGSLDPEARTVGLSSALVAAPPGGRPVPSPVGRSPGDAPRAPARRGGQPSHRGNPLQQPSILGAQPTRGCSQVAT